MEIKIEINDTKAEATAMYLEKQGRSLEEGMQSAFNKLYVQQVPLAVREYLNVKLPAEEQQAEVEEEAQEPRKPRKSRQISIETQEPELQQA